MKPKTVVLMGVAIVCGLIAAFLVSMATATNKGPEMESVLVADQEMRQGTVVTDVKKQFVRRDMPSGLVPVNALKKEEQLEGMQILRTLEKNAVPTQGTVGKYEGLEKLLPVGHRAMTVRVSMDSAVAGFILPGAHVDLLATLQDIRNSKLKLSKIFMQNMLVLAINTQDVRDEKGRTVGNPSTATLAVTPDQAERLTRVVSEGTVWLILRKPDDNKRVKTRGNKDPFEEEKSETGEADVEVYVAAKEIPANTAINDENFGDLFVLKKYPKGTVPSNAVTNEKEIKDAKFVYAGIDEKAVLTKRHLAKPTKEPPVTGPPPVETKQHVLRIHNGQLPVTEVVYTGNVGNPTTPLVPGGPAPGPDAPGSEGK